ncbi:MAG: FadD3 family acyl-CoA ligase [Myxococcales bacterium]|nr:FadD3 family acyl-CoA ligase [Myxococcales bacterium]
MAPLHDIASIGTTPRLVRAAAEAYGSLAAIEEGDVALSFEDLAREGLRAARAFMAAGVEPGDRVAIWAPNVYEWVLAAIGLQSAGAALVPLNTRYKGAEAAYILNKSRARVLCTVGEFLGTDYAALARAQETPSVERVVSLRGASEGAQSWSAFLAEGESVAESAALARALAVSPDDLADVMFTSGTTGKPKGVMTAHGQNLRVFEVWSGVVGLREGDRYLIVNPFFHSFGYKAGWLSSIMRGVTVLPHPVFDVKEVLERVSKDRISVLPAPPTIYQSILAFPDLAKYDISNLRLAVTGAAAVPVELVHRMRDELGFETIVTAYGLTESTGTVSICQPDDDAETIANTSGCAIPDVEVRCVDPDGHEVPRGEPGEVVVRGYNVMKGYFEDEAATREAIDADGWLHTGDIAVMDERGYLRITDRIKDMFIMGGFNCYPAEIESLLFEMPGVAQVAVIGVPDERMGEVGMAFVVPKGGAALTPEAVVAWSRQHMANFKVPRFVKLLDALPVNASGKVTKNELRELAAREGVGA